MRPFTTRALGALLAALLLSAAAISAQPELSAAGDAAAVDSSLLASSCAGSAGRASASCVSSSCVCSSSSSSTYEAGGLGFSARREREMPRGGVYRPSPLRPAHARAPHHDAPPPPPLPRRRTWRHRRRRQAGRERPSRVLSSKRLCGPSIAVIRLRGASWRGKRRLIRAAIAFEGRADARRGALASLRVECVPLHALGVTPLSTKAAPPPPSRQPFNRCIYTACIARELEREAAHDARHTPPTDGREEPFDATGSHGLSAAPPRRPGPERRI